MATLEKLTDDQRRRSFPPVIGHVREPEMQVPFEVTVGEVWQQWVCYESSIHHYYALVLRAAFSVSGPIRIANIEQILHRRLDDVDALLDDLKRNGWEMDGDAIHHPETKCIKRWRRGEKRPANTRRAMSQRLRFTVLEMAGFSCCYCGRKAPDVELHVDHVEPVSKGGSNDPSNLVAACRDCNSGKADRQLRKV